jgi:hypothetical protein
MGTVAREMLGWAVEDTPVGARDGEEGGGNAAQSAQSSGED